MISSIQAPKQVTMYTGLEASLHIDFGISLEKCHTVINFIFEYEQSIMHFTLIRQY